MHVSFSYSAFLAFEAPVKASDMPLQMLWGNAMRALNDAHAAIRIEALLEEICTRTTPGAWQIRTVVSLEYEPAAGVCTGPPDVLGREYMWSLVSGHTMQIEEMQQ
jgi:hypothetical protein